MKIKEQRLIDENYIRGSIRAYIEGKQSVNWLIGILQTSNQSLLHKILQQYPKLKMIYENE